VRASRLKAVPLFASLSRNERKRIAKCAEAVDLPEGKCLVEEGDFAYELFVIEEGTAEVVHDGEHLADLGPGDFLGETGVMERAGRSATVVATSPMKAIIIAAHELRQIARELPDVAEQIRVAIEERGRSLAG
jgi:CRP/FNR family cyclic AMP-dependent transcriptional regulator